MAPYPFTSMDLSGHIAEHNLVHEELADHTVELANMDTATANRVDDTGTATGAALAEHYTRQDLSGLDVRAFGAVGDGSTDDTVAIQAAIDAAAPGQAIRFPATGSGAYFKITDTLTVTTPNLRMIGQPRDGYAVSIRCSTASKQMIDARSTGFVLQDIALIGDTVAANGVGATVKGLLLHGDTDGNLDALIRGCTFQWLAEAVRTHGRNATIETSLFSNSLDGVVIDGPDGAYNVGVSADENRGNVVRDNRFHNIGANGTNSAIEILPAAKVLHALVEGNYFDSNGGGCHIVAVGTSSDLHNRITFRNNKHTEVQVNVYTLTYVQNSTIDGADLGCNVGAGLAATGVVLDHCDTITISDVFALQLGQSGIRATSSNRIRVRDVVIRSAGQDSGSTGHGLDFNSGNTQCRFDRVTVDGTDGWGFIGDVADSAMTDCEFRSCTLGSISSATLVNRGTRGLNRFVEGTDGRKQDEATKSFDLVAGVATDIATVVAGSNFTSFEVEVRVIGRNSAGPLYARYIRYVRPENGTPAYVTPISDHASGTITVSFATLGTTGVTVSTTATVSNAFATVHVQARAGGGAATGNARAVTVSMI